jgi:hypothetical protein
MKYKPGDPVKVKDWEQLNKRPFFVNRFGQLQSENGVAVLEYIKIRAGKKYTIREGKEYGAGPAYRLSGEPDSLWIHEVFLEEDNAERNRRGKKK